MHDEKTAAYLDRKKDKVTFAYLFVVFPRRARYSQVLPARAHGRLHVSFVLAHTSTSCDGFD